MPVYTGTALTNLTFDELRQWCVLSNGGNTARLNAFISEASSYGIGEIDALEDYAASYMNFYRSGEGTHTITSFADTAQINSVSAIDSNLSSVGRSSVEIPMSRVDDGSGNIGLSTSPASGGVSGLTYFLANVGQAVSATSAGIALGRTIDQALYDANPDYWNSIGLSGLDPQTWSSITNGDTSLASGLFNFIFGIDATNGTAQAYMNQDALAYMAYALAQNGWFNATEAITSYPPDMTDITSSQYPIPMPCGVAGSKQFRHLDSDPLYYNDGYHISSSSGTVYYTVPVTFNSVLGCYIAQSCPTFFSLEPFSYSWWYRTSLSNPPNRTVAARSATINGLTVYYSYNNQGTGSVSSNNTTAAFAGHPLDTAPNDYGNYYYMPEFSVTYNANIGYIGLYGTLTSVSDVDGVAPQPNATTPDTSTWTDPASTLSSLQSQYPSWFQNPLTYDATQPDGTATQLTYVPVPTPTATSATDTQPTSGDNTQTQTQTQVDTSMQTLIDLVTQLITDPQPQTQTDTSTSTPTPPQNPVDTGTGDTPTPTAPTGSASALWSVYHPTQAQINSFGAWLWGSPFLTNIGKLFENPIDGVISLMKVFASPVDAGTANIVVGTLDSNVSSATVTQQYVDVDCGYVSVTEDFGNVFDYPPYTTINLYLPFIGIVPLDVNDVMRSTLHVKYGVDVFTGACLAMVEVTRDLCTVNMYQYSGMCGVSYPLSNVQNQQLISGLLTVAGGIASTVASGGVTAPAALAVAGGAAGTMKTSIGKSGGFSGNSGAMGIKKPYLIIQRPQTKVAQLFPTLSGYPTNISGKLSDFSGHVVVSAVHVEGIPATDGELAQIESLLKEGVLV